ncbi:MAG TPA: pantoate--beta-alanine ligase [Legionellaceae bacterium]|nr:pantoate--beta-alanine ligase [Legionellaceae bacterium]
MQIIHSIAEWQTIRKQLPSHLSLGFVPTMGNLHAGHASLFERSLAEQDLSIVSVFVNPTQFNNIQDYQHYPRTLEADFKLLEKMGVDYCLFPTEKEIYPNGYQYRIEETCGNGLMEAMKRPGHFNGVLTVVMILLNIVKPNCAYFGEKDYQQYMLIRDMAKAFFLEVKIKAYPTIREHSGLAYSSRNTRLNAEERIMAEQFASIFHQNKSCAEIHKQLTALGIKVEYIEEHYQRRFAAVYIGDIRLIDNYAVPVNENA